MTQQRASAKNCPECGQPLTPRKNRTTKTEFLGCSNWPACEYTIPISQSTPKTAVLMGGGP